MSSAAAKLVAYAGVYSIFILFLLIYGDTDTIMVKDSEYIRWLEWRNTYGEQQSEEKRRKISRGFDLGRAGDSHAGDFSGGQLYE